MKNRIIILLALSFIPVASFASSLKLLNDTGSKISIHTGSGIAI